MKKFRFRLETLLRLKEYNEHKAKLEVAKTLANIRACEKQIDLSAEERETSSNMLEDKAAEGIPSEKYMRYISYMSGLVSLIQNKNDRLKSLNVTLEKNRKSLSEKSFEKKLMDKLNYIKKEQHMTDIMKKLQKESDDIIIIRKARDINRNDTKTSD